MSARNRLLLPAAAVLLGLSACTAAPSVAASSAPASSAAVPSAVPTSAAPATVAPATSAAPAKKPSGRPAAGCPSAKTLERLVDLPRDKHIVAASVQCWKSWAWADAKGPKPGDGIYLFHRRPGQGWQYHSQGSAFECRDLGIHEPAPFCQYP